MIIATHVPRAPLNEFVELLWFHEGLTVSYPMERVLPDGSMELIFNLREERRYVFDSVSHAPRQTYRRSWFSGPHSEFIVIDAARDASLIGAHLKPGGASAFLGMPLSELRNSVVELDALWGSQAQTLRERLLEVETPAAKFHILEEALWQQWRRVAPRHAMVPHALGCFMREPHSVTIGQVTAEVGLSRRRFIEIFTDAIGMTPKVFCRVQRFQHVLQTMQRNRRAPWTELALECGYYDQAHFANEFKEFCGITPSQYRDAAPEYPNFVPVGGG